MLILISLEGLETESDIALIKDSLDTSFVILPSAPSITILALVAFSGCTAVTGGGTNTTSAASQDNLTQQQAEQILAECLTNFHAMTTYKFDYTMITDATATGGTQAGHVMGKLDTSGGENLLTGELQVAMTITSIEENSGEQSLDYEVFMTTDWLYMKVTLPGSGDQWAKVRMSDKVKEELNISTAGDQTGILDAPMAVKYLRTEAINGVDCYVMDLTPNDAALKEWLSGQNSGMSNAAIPGLEDIGSISDMLTEFSYLCYVAKDTNMLMLTTFNIGMSYSSTQAGYADAFDAMAITITGGIGIHDHNKAFSVVLPDEAIIAEEITQDTLS